jgi:hypothetical protein
VEVVRLNMQVKHVRKFMLKTRMSLNSNKEKDYKLKNMQAKYASRFLFIERNAFKL